MCFTDEYKKFAVLVIFYGVPANVITVSTSYLEAEPRTEN
jgi:hypothetical protein